MADNSIANSYEEVRRQRLEENKKRFEDLGIAKISKKLAVLSNSEKKSKHQQRPSKPKQKAIYEFEPRRSSRARNPISSYRDEVDIDLPALRKRSKSAPSSWASYIARPLDECKTASYEERAQAFKVAEEFQSSLQSGNLSFVKSMVRSHVYSCFWLGLPSKFCEDHLPKATVDMVLEDENGTEYDAVYIGKRVGLSGGWRAFALDHKLDDGDALVFELIEPTRFKIYTFKSSSSSLPSQDETATKVDDDKEEVTAKKKTKRVIQQNEINTDGRSEDFELKKKNGDPASQRLQKENKSGNTRKSKRLELAKEMDNSAPLKPRKKVAPKLFRKRA